MFWKCIKLFLSFEDTKGKIVKIIGENKVNGLDFQGPKNLSGSNEYLYKLGGCQRKRRYNFNSRELNVCTKY